MPIEQVQIPSLLTPREVSQILRIPETTLAIWRSSNRVRLPFTKIGRLVRYRCEDVRRMVDGGSDA